VRQTMLDAITLENLKKAARAAMAQAHAPVSLFPVGAAVLTAAGNIYAGCNTESIIAGVGVCAERSAIDHAVVHGEKSFTAVLVVSQRPEPLFPCGVCRQYLYEFAQTSGHDPLILALGGDGRLKSAYLSQLLPHSFGPRDK